MIMSGMHENVLTKSEVSLPKTKLEIIFMLRKLFSITQSNVAQLIGDRLFFLIALMKTKILCAA